MYYYIIDQEGIMMLVTHERKFTLEEFKEMCLSVFNPETPLVESLCENYGFQLYPIEGIVILESQDEEGFLN